ncbi:MAG TPA: type II toxin-antitoxin system RelE/ParE family toxin [Bacteroidales bacterium]|jgi:plasmid stabilization system protein ParE|nr:type II toxin-antitoxin system RelE/ParE family toxin [Bacteroidales bacterium]HOX74877.1 type II toxin-antitoxin system RelE/ParE family toxin [Bacteroidales bacterium]
MEVKVLWSDTSLTQLQDIFDYYSIRASIAVAKKIIKGIVNRSILLESNPLLGVKEPLLVNRPFECRFIIESNYKIVYRFSENIVRIVSVFDCRQNPQKVKKIEE